MQKTVKWGVIGAGGIASRRTIPEFVKMAKNAELVSVMDINIESAKAVAEKYKVPHFCSTEKELLAQDIDAVYIATPLNMHCSQVVQAAKAGKHILCEKPMAASEKEVKVMEKACKENRVKFMMGFCMRNNPYHIKLREMVKKCAVGQVVMGRAQLTCWYPPIKNAWRQDIKISHGGSFIDMGTHCIDILEWIMGAKAVEVTGFQDLMTHKYKTKVEDASTILVRFSNGAHGVIDNYFNMPDAAAQNSLELHGTKGSVIAQGTIGQQPSGKMFSIIQPQETGYSAKQDRNMKVSRKDYKLTGQGLYGQMINTFSRCILDGKEPPVTLKDGLHSVKVVNAVYKAVKERRVVKVQ
jgi:predicted dehydrogenase